MDNEVHENAQAVMIFRIMHQGMMACLQTNVNIAIEEQDGY